jgi:ferritin-like metal-binding protein YciE
LFDLFGQKAKSATCEGIKGIIEDAEDIIAAYGTLR